MRQRLLAFAALVAVVTGAVALLPDRAAAQVPPGGFPCGPSGANLTCTITSVTTQGNQILLSGTVRNAAGQTLDFTEVRLRELAGTAGAGVCEILSLELGPINLDLLGLQVDTNRILIDITAVAGPGNLLGNLLCAVTNLLNPSQSDLVAAILRGLLGL